MTITIAVSNNLAFQGDTRFKKDALSAYVFKLDHMRLETRIKPVHHPAFVLGCSLWQGQNGFNPNTDGPIGGCVSNNVIARVYRNSHFPREILISTVSFIVDTPSMITAKRFFILMSLIDPLEHHRLSHLPLLNYNKST